MDKEDLKNYGPVSNIRYLSKVIETVVCSRITQYLDGHKLLDPLQSAYRVGHSTETALFRVHNDILRIIVISRAVFLVMIDLSAAFDTLDHDILLQRSRDQSGSLELLFSGSRPTLQEEHIGSMLQVPTLMSITLSSVSLKDLFSAFVNSPCTFLL